MQARWGSHGDYGVLALCPNSPQECFDLTIKAFNLSEQYRQPVFLMMDECVGHMTEKVVIPDAREIDIYPRRHTSRSPADYRPYEPMADGVPEMAHAGEGYRFHVTGLTHDERGYPSMTVETQDRLVRRLVSKSAPVAEQEALYETEALEDADVVVVSYGITSRVAEKAIKMARAQGVRTGKFRLITAWPFPAGPLAALTRHAKAFVVPELNLGQMVHEVERAVALEGGLQPARGFSPAAKPRVIPVTHAGGSVHQPEQILAAIVASMEASR
jgi:2-oxoglutarate ferredoxin oxidoreductase subunit alpha